jgi:hypothetical protein
MSHPIEPGSITPGQNINIKIVKRPTNEAALKTIRRVLGKDSAVQKEDRIATNRRRRGFTTKPRGGRPWNLHKSRLLLIHGQPGEGGTVKATLDVIRDLGKLAKFIEITAAK